MFRVPAGEALSYEIVSLVIMCSSANVTDVKENRKRKKISEANAWFVVYVLIQRDGRRFVCKVNAFGSFFFFLFY